jgi:hypothetical protein
MSMLHSKSTVVLISVLFTLMSAISATTHFDSNVKLSSPDLSPVEF